MLSSIGVFSSNSKERLPEQAAIIGEDRVGQFT